MSSSSQSRATFSFESGSDDDCEQWNGLDGGGCEDYPSAAPAEHAHSGMPSPSRFGAARPATSASAMCTPAGASLSTSAMSTSSMSTASSRPRTDGRGKYSRLGGKGVHLNWDDRCREHLSMYANGSWLQQSVCVVGCPFGGECLSRVSKIDVRDCAEHIFGHSQADALPTVRHGIATARWFDVVHRSRVVDMKSVNGTQLSFRLLHGSGLEVCSGACRFLYAAPPTTWDAMQTAVRTNEREWRPIERASVNITKRSSETKKNDASVWWLDRFEMCACETHRNTTHHTKHLLLWHACRARGVLTSHTPHHTAHHHTIPHHDCRLCSRAGMSSCLTALA